MVNSHYIPQFVLRHFSENERIQYCDIDNRKVERRNIKTTFSEKGYYPDEIESNLCNKTESQFAKLLNDRILKEKYRITLTRDELFILKKYLIVSIMRYDLTEQYEMDGSVPDDRIQSYSDTFYKNINKVLNCSCLDDMMQYVNIDPFKYLNSNDANKELGDIKLFADVKNILHSYIVFVRTNRSKEKFIVPDTGFAYQATHLSVYSNDKFDKCMYTLNYAMKTGNPYIFHVSQLLSPYDYYICPVSDDMAIVSLSSFFKFFNKKSDIYGMVPIDGLSVRGMIGFGDSDMVEAPHPNTKYGKPVSYDYAIKQLTANDVYYLNSDMINNSLHFIGFKDLKDVKASIQYYTNLPASAQKYDLNFVLGQQEKNGIGRNEPLKVENAAELASKFYELMVNQTLGSAFDSAVYSSIRNETFIVDDNNNSFIKSMAAENVRKSGNKYACLESEIIRIIISEILRKKNPYDYPNICDAILPTVMQVSKVFDVNEFKDDIYMKNINIESSEYDGITLGYEEYQPYELFVYNVPCWIETLGINVPRLGCFTEKCRYPVMIRKKDCMLLRSVSPNEIETLRLPIKRASGNVLVLGAGMGYYAYAVSMKEEVKSVTVIESDITFYNIFKNIILPQFEFKDKVKVINTDELKYLESISDGKYNYCFSDICSGIEDIETYFKVKEAGKKFRKTEIDYWIEGSFACQISGCVFPEIIAAASEYKENIYDEKMIPETEMRLIKYVRQLLRGVVVSSIDELNYYITPKNILKMIENTEIKF